MDEFKQLDEILAIADKLDSGEIMKESELDEELSRVAK